MKININNLNVKFPENRTVLNNISFDIKINENILIIGPSGSGKTTLLNVISGIIPNQIDATVNGNIDVGGLDPIKMQSELTERIGVIFQNPEDMFATLKVEDEIAFSLENRLFDKDLARSRIMDKAGKLELRDKLDRDINSLSGGEKQKLAIACIEAMEPELLLLDEPTALLDPNMTKDFFAYLHKSKRQFLIVEHKIDNIIDIIDKVLLLDEKGSIIDYDKPSNIFNKCGKTRYFKPKIFNLSCLISEKYNFKTTIKKSDIRDFLVMNRNILKIPLYERNTKEEKIAVKIRDLYFNFDKKEFRYGNLNIYQGTIHSILGNNGSGKTTLLNLLSGFLSNYKGLIEIFDKDVKDYKKTELYNMLGYVFQNPEMQFFKYTVWDEINFSKKYVKEDIGSIGNLINEFYLNDVLSNSPFNISTGEKRRLSVLLMTIYKQRILLLDEPTFGQDWETSIETMNLLTRLKNEGITIIIVTHDIDNAIDNSDYITIISDQGELKTYNIENIYQSSFIKNYSDPLYDLLKDINKETGLIYNMITLKQWERALCRD
jgi:energy-coupling factor transport system ATP-binding protein